MIGGRGRGGGRTSGPWTPPAPRRSVAARYAGLGEAPSPAAGADRPPDWARLALATCARPRAESRTGSPPARPSPGPLGAVPTGRRAGARRGSRSATRRSGSSVSTTSPWSARTPPPAAVRGREHGRPRRELDADRDLFLRWIALHETTHVIQFERVRGWRPTCGGLAGELIEGAARRRRSPGSAPPAPRPPRAGSQLLRGELARCSPIRRAPRCRPPAGDDVGDRGSRRARHGRRRRQARPGLAELRRRLDERRAGAGARRGLAAALGMELKLRQYSSARRSATRRRRAGGEGLRRVWRSPAACRPSPSSSARRAGSSGSPPFPA